MKYAEFAGLCSREMAHAGHTGDVCHLGLTDGSHAELTADVIAEGVMYMTAGDSCGMLLSCLVNPATGTAVKVESGAAVDMYQVSRVVPYGVLASEPSGL